MNNEVERRCKILERVKLGKMSIVESSELLGVSERQAKRLNAAYRKYGVRGLVHGNQGKRPWNKTSKEIEEKVVEAQQSGKEIDEKTREEYTAAMQEVQGKSKVQALISSQENYMKMMNKVNSQISEGIQEGAQSRIITNF